MNYTCPDGEHLCQTRYYPQLINRKVTFPNIMVSLTKVVVGTLRTLVRKYTAVSRKVVLQTGKSLRDNVESNYGFYVCLIGPQGVSLWWKETTQTRVFILSRTLLLNHLERQSSETKFLLPIMPVRIFAYAFILFRNNLRRNSCIPHEIQTVVSTKIVPQEHKSARDRQCRLVLWAAIVCRYLVEVHGVKLEGKRMHEYTCLRSFLL